LFANREFKQRKAIGASPKNLKELFDMGSKWKKGSDPNVAALLFASASFVGFSLWESLIVHALDIFPYLLVTLPVGVMAAAFLLKRRENFHPWSQEESLWAMATLGALAGACFCWILFPWVFYRSKFLKKT
jgi:hypothetical protein